MAFACSLSQYGFPSSNSYTGPWPLLVSFSHSKSISKTQSKSQGGGVQSYHKQHTSRPLLVAYLLQEVC